MHPWVSQSSIVDLFHINTSEWALLLLLLLISSHSHWTPLIVSAGCLLTIILLMRALDPLGYEKETLTHFQTLKVSTNRLQSMAMIIKCICIQYRFDWTFIFSLRKWIPCAPPITVTCAASLWLKTLFWKWSMLKCASSVFLTRLAWNNDTKSYLGYLNPVCHVGMFWKAISVLLF